MMASALPTSRYDYIVVGAGSGGCPVVRRLIDGTDATVLIVEAGESGLGDKTIEDPASWVDLLRGHYDWGYDYAPAPHVDNRVLPIPRGRVLGGSSAINAMMWYRGHPADYDAWDAAGAAGWRFEDVLPFFRRAEDWQGGATALRGSGGPLRITRSPHLHPVAEALRDAAGEVGIPIINDPNGPTNEGATASNFNIADGRRWHSAIGYLLPVLDDERLTVLTNSLTVALLIENGRCVGIRHRVGNETTETCAGSGVILAAGAIDSPRLLMLSGIGDAEELNRLGISVVHDLPGVGRNLQDHPLVQACVFKAARPLGPRIDNGGGTMINWRSEPDRARPDVHSFPVQGNSATEAVRRRYETDGEVFSIGFGLMHSRSVGHLKMLSAEPLGPLHIQPNYFAEPGDMAALKAAFQTVQDMAETPPLRDWIAGWAAPDRRLSDHEAEEFIRDGCSTFFHTCGTCRMGNDDLAVTDPRLKVRGIDGLTIADASVIPIIPTCNTHAPVTMIGERAAQFLMEDA